MCVFAESFLESKGMHEIFQKKGKKMLKRAKNAIYLKIWAKMYQVRKSFLKGQVNVCVIIACNKLLQKALIYNIVF